MSLIPTKLARERKIDNKCKIHKYRRFTLKNKTFRTDVYYCATCSHKVPIIDIYGTKSICWQCKQPHYIGTHNFVYPKCENCRRGKIKTKTNSINPPDDITLDFLESSVESEIEDSGKSEVFDLLKELGLI